MKAISGQDWGDKEMLRLKYNAYLKPSIIYLVPVWFPSVGPDAACIKNFNAVRTLACMS
jgi:hypothetical protein